MKGQPIGKLLPLYRDEGSVNMFDVKIKERESNEKQVREHQPWVEKCDVITKTVQPECKNEISDVFSVHQVKWLS